MRQKLHLITLGVKDFQKSLDFYEKGLGWKKSSASQDGLAVFPLGGMALALYARESLAKDMDLADSPTGFSGLTLSYNTESEPEVDEILEKVKGLGGTVIKSGHKAAWGGYIGYFQDLDGHLFEVAYNPFWKFDADYNLSLPL